MAKYGEKAQDKVERAMHERKEGTLTSGSTGKKVTSRKQAIAIGLAEARKEGGKVPPPPKRAAAEKESSSSAPKKTAVKKAAPKKTAAKKAAPKKAAAKKATSKK